MSQKQNQEPKDEISSTITMTSSSISDLWGFYENIINKKYSKASLVYPRVWNIKTIHGSGSRFVVRGTPHEVEWDVT
jgi:hypothetical protein